MSINFTHPPLILDGKWRTIDGDPAGPYFQKPLNAEVCMQERLQKESLEMLQGHFTTYWAL